MFTVQHYKAVAGVIRDASYLDNASRSTLIERFISKFQDDNDRFNPVRFLASCCPDRDDDVDECMACLVINAQATGLWSRGHDLTEALIIIEQDMLTKFGQDNLSWYELFLVKRVFGQQLYLTKRGVVAL